MKRFTPFFLSTLWFASATAGETPASVAELFGTPEKMSIIREPDRVDACLLNYVQPAQQPDGNMSTERYEETAFTPVPAAAAAALRDLLLNENTYRWKASPGRRLRFSVRLRFQRDAEVLTIDFCPQCQVLSVARKTESMGRANFGGNADLILQAFVKAFPDSEPLKLAARRAGLPEDALHPKHPH